MQAEWAEEISLKNIKNLTVQNLTGSVYVCVYIYIYTPLEEQWNNRISGTSK